MHGHGSVEHAGVTHRYTYTLEKDGRLKITCLGVIRLETYLPPTTTREAAQGKGEEMLMRALRRGLESRLPRFEMA